MWAYFKGAAMKKTFNQVVGDFVQFLTKKMEAEGKVFYIHKGNKLENVTQNFHSGSLMPLLIYEMNNRRFEMFEGYSRTGPVDWFRHNTNANFIMDSSTLLGVRVMNIEEKNLAISKQDFLLHLADAMKSLYNSSPNGFVYMNDNKGVQFERHLEENEQIYHEQMNKVRVLNPIINQFHQWRALYESFAIAVLTDPNRIKDVAPQKFQDDITYSIVRERLNQLDGVVLPRELFGTNEQPYYKQIQSFMAENMQQEAVKASKEMREKTENKDLQVAQSLPTKSPMM